MTNSVNENLDSIKKNEKRYKSAVIWLKTLNLDNEKLIQLSASLMVITKEVTENLGLSDKKVNLENSIDKLLNLMGNGITSSSEINNIIAEFKINSICDSHAATTIEKVVALSNKVHKKKSQSIAKIGGDTRSSKFKKLQSETIRLYKLGTWKSVPIAAQEITPSIVEFSKKGNGDLLPSTKKPLEWIREYERAKK